MMKYIVLISFFASVLSQTNLRGNVEPTTIVGDHELEW